MSQFADQATPISESRADHSVALKQTLKQIESLRISTDQWNSKLDSRLCTIEDELTKVERQHILTWLCSIDPSTNHNTAVESREQDTGLWFLESDHFSDWINFPGLMWLHGIRECSPLRKSLPR